MDNVEVRAFAMPERFRVAGKTKVPVVVMLDQGASPAGGGGSEDALVPVGAAAVDAVGNFDAGSWNRGSARDKKPDDKRYPVRMFHLMDASPSMGEYSGAGDIHVDTKLKLVQGTISRLADSLPDGIKHVLIPYSDQLHLDEGGSFDEPNKLVAAIKKLTTRGGTDIGIPIAEALRQIKAEPDSPEGIEYRNLINLISDGEAERNRPLKLASEYPAHNAAAFSLGVGPRYDEALMHGVVENAGFGGYAHIPQTGKKQVVDIFGKILPDFVHQMLSAPYYPVIKFNKWFDSVINMTPSTRAVGIDQKTATMVGLNTDYFKYRAAVGYQNRGFVVGFLDEDKLKDAVVELEINESAAKAPLETQDLEIEDFGTLGLDPKDIELLRNIPVKALKMQITQEHSPKKIQEFLDENPDLDSVFKENLEAELELLKQDRVTGNANNFRSRSADDSMSFTVMTMMDVAAFGGDADPMDASPTPDRDIDTVGASGHCRDYTQLATGGINAGAGVQAVQRKTPGEIVLKFTGLDPQRLQMVKNGVVCYEFAIKPGEKLSFGRHSSNSIRFAGADTDRQRISKYHGYFELIEGKLFIVDKGSTNGTQINDVEKNIKANEQVRLRDQDIVNIAGNKFRINFEQAQ